MKFAVNKLFVYGIFLSETMREQYGMSNPIYATVAGYLTMGRHIVVAVPVPERPDICLTGLLVDVDPSMWGAINRLESAYNRIEVATTDGDKAYMYAAKEEK